MRIENISLKFNLVSNSSRGHRKRTKKLKERRRSGEPLCSREELRSKKKMEKKRLIKKKTEAT